MTTSRKVLLSLAAIALAQTAVLAYMVIDRLMLLRSGREIVLPIIPVDPRDLFRGEYVRLSYAANAVPTKLLEGPPPAENAAFYVVLEKQGDGTWRAARLAQSMPRESSPDRIVLKGRTNRAWPQTASDSTIVMVRYGIESYFVPEGQGRKLEDLAREKKLATLLAVDSRGNAAIKGLLIDGVLQYEEPLF